MAPIPLRLPRVEAALVGQPPTMAALAAAAGYAVEGANPLPMTSYKAALLVGAVTEAVERAAGVAEPTIR